ncbi:hypothetical protein [Anaeromyxobacter soli]|uniref:hypothetical protein n=1 Tax=Anaeromyxobacter soli TaxID=2922725 RepID=UPI001FAFE0AA|nr:hypothetical protein [Anaeromyxobacter sp. SG29]
MCLEPIKALAAEHLSRRLAALTAVANGIAPPTEAAPTEGRWFAAVGWLTADELGELLTLLDRATGSGPPLHGCTRIGELIEIAEQRRSTGQPPLSR